MDSLQTETTSPESNITAELLPGTELDSEAERAFREQWQATGECREPNIIGRLELSEAASALLEIQLGDEYVSAEHPDLFSPVDIVAAREAGAEEIDTLPKESRALLLSAWDKFAGLVQEDIERSNSSSDLMITGQVAYLGGEQGYDFMHIDRVENCLLRYIVTITGPTTRFYTGNIPSSLFNDKGNLAQDSLPEGTVISPAPEGGLVRFLSDADPHCAPVDQQGVFRVVLIASVGQRSTS